MPASQLLGGAVRFWHDQLFCKPAQHGGVVAWHQDYSNWIRTKPMAVNVVKDGVYCDSDQLLLGGTDPIPKGQPLGGQF